MADDAGRDRPPGAAFDEVQGRAQMLHDQGQQLVVEAHAGAEIAGEGELEIALRGIRHIADGEAVLMGELGQEIEAEGMLVLGGRFVDIGAGVERHAPDEALDALAAAAC